MRVSRPRGPIVGRAPRVEVVIPCYNYGAHLPACVSTVMTQPGVEVTATIVDDASTDDSHAVAEGLARAWPGVRVIRNDRNLGAVRTFNVGLEQADSDYVVLLSADDLMAPESLARSAALMDAHPQIGLVYGHAQKFVETPALHGAMPAVTWTTWDGNEWIRMQLRRAWNNISSPEAMVRTGTQHQVGYYSPDLPHTHDLHMWLRVAEVSAVGHVNGIDQAYYRRHASSLSSMSSALNDVEERWRAYSRFLDAWSLRDDAETLRPLVARRLADEALAIAIDDAERGAGDPSLGGLEHAMAAARSIDSNVVDREPWLDALMLTSGRQPEEIRARVRQWKRQTERRIGKRRWDRWRYLG